MRAGRAASERRRRATTTTTAATATATTTTSLTKRRRHGRRGDRALQRWCRSVSRRAKLHLLWLDSLTLARLTYYERLTFSAMSPPSPSHTVAASVPYRCSLHHIWLQPPSHTVAGAPGLLRHVAVLRRLRSVRRAVRRPRHLLRQRLLQAMLQARPAGAPPCTHADAQREQLHLQQRRLRRRRHRRHPRRASPSRVAFR